MNTKVIEDLTLKDMVHSYLYDAGFKKNLYKIKDYDREYLEVFFLCNEAVDYIKYDIIRSKFKELLEIKKYRHQDGNCSAIISYI